jgi:anti-anti-sigma factor
VPLLTVAHVPAHEGIAVLRLTGDADLSTLPLLAGALAHAVDTGAEHVVVEAAEVRFWDSSNLRALAAVTTELTASGRTCRIVGAGAATRRLIQAADYGSVLDLDGPGSAAAHGGRGTATVDGVRSAA